MMALTVENMAVQTSIVSVSIWRRPAYWCHNLRGYTEKFGLHSVNMSDPERARTAKQSSVYYSQVSELFDIEWIRRGFQSKTFNSSKEGTNVFFFFFFIIVLDFLQIVANNGFVEGTGPCSGTWSTFETCCKKLQSTSVWQINKWLTNNYPYDKYKLL